MFWNGKRCSYAPACNVGSWEKLDRGCFFGLLSSDTTLCLLRSPPCLPVEVKASTSPPSSPTTSSSSPPFSPRYAQCSFLSFQQFMFPRSPGSLHLSRRHMSKQKVSACVAWRMAPTHPGTQSQEWGPYGSPSSCSWASSSACSTPSQATPSPCIASKYPCSAPSPSCSQSEG